MTEKRFFADETEFSEFQAGNDYSAEVWSYSYDASGRQTNVAITLRVSERCIR